MMSFKPNQLKPLRQLPLFEGISEPALAALERACFRRKVDKGTRLFFRGDPADNFYLLLSGEVVISLTSSDGRELVINQIQPGDFFGELGLLTGQPRSADAIVRQTAELVAIPRQAFLAALAREPLAQHAPVDFREPVEHGAEEREYGAADQDVVKMRHDEIRVVDLQVERHRAQDDSGGLQRG